MRISRFDHDVASTGKRKTLVLDQYLRFCVPSVSNSRENLSEDDSESTDDSFDRFTDHQVHLSTSRQWLFVMYDIWVLFLLLIEIISIAKLLIMVHFFVLKHEKQTLSYTHTAYEGDKTNFFFSSIYFVGVPVFLPQHRK